MTDPQAVPGVGPKQLQQRLEAGEPLVLLDVREQFEWKISNLGSYGARLIPMGELPDRLGELDPAAPVVVYCRTGARSDMVARFLIDQGFERVWNLEGGINGWAWEVDPRVRVY